MEWSVGDRLADETQSRRFQEIALPHLDAAYNLARWLTRNDDDAQDIVQEAFLRAFKSFAGFHGSNGRAWLLTIVRNTAYTLLKKNKTAESIAPFDEQMHDAPHEAASPVGELGRQPIGIEVQKRRRNRGLAPWFAHQARVGIHGRRLLADRELNTAAVVERSARRRNRHVLAVLARRQLPE